MTDFQVGDRVSVEGVVVVKTDKTLHITLSSHSGQTVIVPSDRDVGLTLIERPKRKLRVGSVWERWGVRWAVGANEDGDQHLVRLTDGARVEIDLIVPDEWREVPVEELEAEANA